MMDDAYTPELGQACFGNPWGAHAVSAIGEAAIQAVIDDFSRVYWNVNQTPWEYATATIGGVCFRPYWWGADDAPGAELPNLCLEGDDLQVRWYKHPGRGTTATKAMSPADWATWLEKCLAALAGADVK